jgi:CDP-diacylglycerol--glycerol-3-phosphate 3-phosphatidyltransferase
MVSRRIQQRVRQFVTSIMRPLARLGITPDTLTLLGLLLSCVTAVVIAQGSLLIGGLLVLFAGIFDMFDGALARARNAASAFGAFFDSTLDRYSESIILFGLLWYAMHAQALQNTFSIPWPPGNEQAWMISLIYIAIVGSLMVSYTKARAEGLGLELKTGMLARPERVVILAIGLITGMEIWAVLLLAVFSNVTAVQRIAHIWRVTRQPTQQNVHGQAQAAAGHIDDFPVDGRAGMKEPEEDRASNRQKPVGTSEGMEPLLPSVYTAFRRFTGVYSKSKGNGIDSKSKGRTGP